ncbi:GIY-YIG nuclease family protein [Eionea flava]
MKQPTVYLLANKPYGTLYIGVTSQLIKRIWQHKNNQCSGFTQQYNIHNLVWYEQHQNMLSAIAREKQLKNWKRQWKIQLIETINAEWKDLYYSLL